jgi:hypothetical protein
MVKRSAPERHHCDQARLMISEIWIWPIMIVSGVIGWYLAEIKYHLSIKIRIKRNKIDK